MRDEFVARFSADKATRLDLASRSKHSLGVCQECERFSEWVESFPYKGKGMGKYLPGSAGSPSVETQMSIMAYDGNWSDWCRCCRWSRQLLQ